MSVFRTRDYRTIKQLATHPSIFPHISDDFTNDPEKWEPIRSEIVTYLLATDEQGPFGFGIFIPDTWACWRAHLAFLPRSYGKQAIESFKEMLEWMWKNTEARRIVGEIARDNARGISFAVRAGCSIYGVNEKSYLQGGQLKDRVCLGISKEK